VVEHDDLQFSLARIAASASAWKAFSLALFEGNAPFHRLC